jgi:hypothetical protein
LKAFYFITAVVVSAVSAMAQTSPFSNVRQYDTGMVGIAAGQTAKFNVFYPTIPAPLLQVTCSATLVISDDQGNTLKSLPVQQLIAGKSASVDLNADTDLPGRPRVQIRAHVLTPQPGTTGAPCTFLPTLELLDNASGKTTVVVKGELTWPLTQSTPPPSGTTPGITIIGNPGN